MWQINKRIHTGLFNDCHECSKMVGNTGYPKI